MKNNPEFVIFTGPMFGGKTTKLLSAIERYKYQNREIYTFKPKIDSRYVPNHIVTHWGGKIKASQIENGLDIKYVLEKVEKKNIVIAVDEAFMIPGAGECLIDFFKNGSTVLVSTLQLASTGGPYEEIQKMLPWATKIEICPAVCTTCGVDAFYTSKTGGKPETEIEVGGSDLYEPRCWQHYDKINDDFNQISSNN